MYYFIFILNRIIAQVHRNEISMMSNNFISSYGLVGTAAKRIRKYLPKVRIAFPKMKSNLASFTNKINFYHFLSNVLYIPKNMATPYY